MTTVNINTFNGPNQGVVEGYVPQTTIYSATMDADLNQIKHDLDYHLAVLQIAFDKLDQINLADLGAVTAQEIIDALSASNLKINEANLSDLLVLTSELTTALQNHIVTTVSSEMHEESSIKGTGLAYSNTPTSFITSCSNLLDELKNIRYQIHRINGKTTWVDTPDSTLTSLKAAMDASTAAVNAHKADSTVHVTSTQAAALNASHNPSGANPFATVSDISGMGSGDMVKAVYDTNGNGIIDKAAGIMDGALVKTYSDIITRILTEINTHTAKASAHHSRYTDAEARGAVNSDPNHTLSAVHSYTNLTNKPFTTTQVTNLAASKLADGSMPWAYKADLSNGLVVPTEIPNLMPLPTAWTNEYQRVATNTYYSSAYPGVVENSLVGPMVILGGMGYRTVDYGYLQVSVDWGATWVDCFVSPEISVEGENIKVWYCPPMYVPSGRVFKIRAGSTFGPGSSSSTFGGGYHIQYRQL